MSTGATTRPTSEHYDDVFVETIDLAVRGATTSAVLARPTAAGPHPAIAVGAEGAGVNSFIRRVAATLAHLGYVTIVPDYYRGGGPADPEDYADIDGMMSHIGALDFRRAVQDLLAGVDHLQSLPDVDPARVASWGYCTGATLALFVACVRHDLAASVLFYPSQPTFDVLDATKPVHALDLLWNIACPTLFVVGDLDVVLPPERLVELRERLARWDVDATIATYPNAQHAFSAETSEFYDRAADEQSWEDAVAFVEQHLRPH
jgi:carboxymethylenebutenolidase